MSPTGGGAPDGALADALAAIAAHSMQWLRAEGARIIKVDAGTKPLAGFADEEQGFAYLPLTSATNDMYGGHRLGSRERAPLGRDRATWRGGGAPTEGRPYRPR